MERGYCLSPERSRDGLVLAVNRKPCFGSVTDALVIVPPVTPERTCVLVDNVWSVRPVWARQHDRLVSSTDDRYDWSSGQCKLELQLAGGYYVDPDCPTLLWTTPDGEAHAWSHDDGKLLVCGGSRRTHALATGFRTCLVSGNVPDWRRRSRQASAWRDPMPSGERVNADPPPLFTVRFAHGAPRAAAAAPDGSPGHAKRRRRATRRSRKAARTSGDSGSNKSRVAGSVLIPRST